MFKEVNTGKKGITFKKVGPELEELPNWIDPDAVGGSTQFVSLKPPRVPSGVGESEVSPLDEMPAGVPLDDWDELSGLGLSPTADEDASPEAEMVSEEPEVKRTTVVEELVPRADEEAIIAVQQAIAELMATRNQVVSNSETQVLNLVRSITERVLARELALDPGLVHTLVREGLSALSGGDRVTVRVGEFFGEVTAQLEQAVLSAGVAGEVVVDPRLGPYGCRIETEWGSVDESVESRLRTLLESMSIPPPAR